MNGVFPVSNNTSGLWKTTSIGRNSLATLSTMDIPLWARRPSKDANLFFLEPTLFSKVLVVLAEKIAENDVAAQQVFQGMLKVLNLSSNEIAIAWFTKNTQELSMETQQALQYWQADHILILGKNIKTESNIFVTYHPKELVNAPQHKKEAYQVLLSLKEKLHRGVLPP